MKTQKYAVMMIVIVLLFSISGLATVGEISETTEEGEFPYPGDPWAWEMIGTQYAHQMDEYGDEVLVAVLDTGIDYNHPDLEDKMWDGMGYDFVNDDDDPMDEDGHGTHVAGIVSSIAPEAELMALKVIEEEGGDWKNLRDAIDYSIENGADIITMSLGAERGRLRPPVERGINDAYNEGILLTAAAGNDDKDDEFFPAAYDSVIGVSSVNSTKEKAQYSNYGDWIEMVAPGGDSERPVFSTILDGSYGNKIGTSMACPFVTGAAALRMSARPGESNQEVREVLQETAIDLGDEYYYGHGLVNAYLAAGGEVPTPPQNLVQYTDDSVVKLEWDEPWEEGLSSVEGYRIYRGIRDEEKEQIAEVGLGQLSYEDTDVENEVNYGYYVTAFNEKGESFQSKTVWATPREEPVVPGPPRNIEAELLDEGVEINWEVPFDDGTSLITSYMLYRKEKSGEDDLLEEVDGETFTYFDETVHSDTEYRYSVSAINEEGEGEKAMTGWLEVPEDHVTDPVEDETPESLPEWLIEREIPVVPAIIVLFGLVFFMIFAVVLHSEKRKNYRK
ncbi:MAG: S8 family serine peptidase [Candidatus Natronoplasma sp.]